MEHLTTDGDRFVVTTRDGRVVIEGTYTLDPTTKAVNWTDTFGADAGKTFPAIYSLEGDELKLCIPVVEPGKKDEAKRPDNFDTKGKPAMCFTCKREKS